MEIKVTAKDCVRIIIDDWVVWIDNSTGEKSISQFMLDEEEKEK